MNVGSQIISSSEMGKVSKPHERLFNQELDYLNLQLRKMEKMCEVISHMKTNFDNYNIIE